MFLYLLISIVALVLLYFKWSFSYWQRHGFPYAEPQGPLGVLDPIIRKRKESPGTAIYDIYRQHKERVVGIYLATRPALLVRDAALARDMMTKDFQSFHDRGIYVNEMHDPMSGGLFFLKGQKWRLLRAKLAPTFTSGKLKAMFGTVYDVSCRMVDHIEAKLKPNGQWSQLETKMLFATFSIDIIASSIFGLEVDSFKNPANPILNVSKTVNENSFRGVLRTTSIFMLPILENIFQSFGWKEPAPENMKKLVRRTIEYREKNNIVRKDMLQLLLQLRNTGKINDDEDEWLAERTKDAVKSLSIETIAAQLFLFFVAGYETSAATAAFTLYELAKQPDLMQKARDDVEQALLKHGNELSYDCLQDMKFMDLCILETTRKYPGLPFLNRECTQDFKIPETDLTIKKGTPILMPLLGYHRDEKYFPNAMGYDPERFLPERQDYDASAFMPFGEGPRHCIAQRMGKINVKVALAQILKHFEVQTNPNAPEIEIDKYGLSIMPKGGVLLNLRKKQAA